IKKMNLPTPGRAGNYTDEDVKEESEGQNEEKTGNAEALEVVKLLGGRENVVHVDACITRLGETTNDSEKVASEGDWKSAGALGLVLRDKGVQAIYGPKADVLKSEIQDYLGN